MDRYPESIDPYDKDSANLFVRVEHLARYLYADEFIRKRKLKHALDCACGSGYGSLLMAAHAETVLAVDGNESLLRQGETACGERGIGNVQFRRDDLNEGLGFIADGAMDCAVCFETLEHIEQDERLLLEFARILKRGWWLLLSAPKEGYEPADKDGRPENPWHLRLYSADGLQRLAERCGFAVERALGQPYTNLSRANMESCRRDRGLSYGDVDGYFTQTAEALAFYAKVWGWPTDEAVEKSSVILLVCRRL